MGKFIGYLVKAETYMVTLAQVESANKHDHHAKQPTT